MTEPSGWCKDTALLTGALIETDGVYILMVPEVEVPGVRMEQAPDGEIMRTHAMVRMMFEPGATLLCMN